MKPANRFQAPILCILSLLIGLASGWWLRDNQNTSAFLPVANNKSRQSSPPRIATGTIRPVYDPAEISQEKTHSDFFQALNSEQFDHALIIFQYHEQFHSDTAAELHAELINRVHQFRTDNNLEPAITLLEQFTRHYDQDTELLGELASCYLAANQFDRALNIYTTARSYSYTREDIRWFDEQIHQIARELYEKHRGLASLAELIPAFLKLSYLEPDYSLYRLALAEGYLMVNDPESAIRELQILSMDNELNEQANQLLARLLAESRGKIPDYEKIVVPLTDHAGHFVVDSMAGSQHNVRLLIDTGASLTTLPHRILAELQQKKQARKIGDIDLTTATGIYRTPLYRVDQFKIGDFLISNLEAAEFGPIDQTIDGLLGMNILNHFDFFIDQSLHQLSLMPRQME